MMTTDKECAEQAESEWNQTHNTFASTREGCLTVASRAAQLARQEGREEVITVLDEISPQLCDQPEKGVCAYCVCGEGESCARWDEIKAKLRGTP